MSERLPNRSQGQSGTGAAGPDPGSDLVRGLPMFSRADPEARAQEKAELAALGGKGVLSRWRWYLGKSGPGWMQSALTLGAGSATASLFAGAYLQYDLLWVQPVGMILGVIVLMAVSHQTLSTGARPLGAVKRYVHSWVAYAWVLASIAATVIWHFPQYALAGGMTEDMISVATGWQAAGAGRTVLLLGIGLAFLGVSTAITWRYAGGSRGIRMYERVLKLMVWMILIAFAIVVIRTAWEGKIEWGNVGRGFLPLKIPTDPKGFSVLMGALAAAVGINMTFLYPYTLLARGWGREHRSLARFDLVTGMLLPYVVATSLMIIAAGCTIYDPARFAAPGTSLSPKEAAVLLEPAVGQLLSRFVFGLGLVGMALSSITMHMLVSGFAVCELFGIEPEGWKYKLACLLPAPGMLGVVVWKYMGPWIGVPTSAICGLLLPIAYVAFFLLNDSRDYLGKDRPRGGLAIAWNIGMLVAILVVTASGCYYVYVNRGVFGIE